MKKSLSAIIAVATISFVAAPPAQASLGRSCSKVGSISGTQAKPLVCRRVKGKRVWVVQTASKRAPGVLSQPTRAAFLGQNLGMFVGWSAPSDGGSGPVVAYRLEFMTTISPWQFVADLPSNQYSQYIRSEELNGYVFRFRVAAVNSHGVGPYSESGWATYGVVTAGTGGIAAPTIVPANPTTPATTPATTTTTTTVPSGTVSQRNAVSRAASYLRSSAFSRSGLISQLEYEGFSRADAIYGTDAQNANWGQQAVRMGASYLRSMAFSRDGLVGQLEYEGFSPSEATLGADSQNADWFAQAAKMAASYLRSSPFSRSGLINQLLYEKFTLAQAEYGANAVGL